MTSQSVNRYYNHGAVILLPIWIAACGDATSTAELNPDGGGPAGSAGASGAGGTTTGTAGAGAGAASSGSGGTGGGAGQGGGGAGAASSASGGAGAGQGGGTPGGTGGGGSGGADAAPGPDAGAAGTPDSGIAGAAGDADARMDSSNGSSLDLTAHLLETAEGAESELPPHGVPEYWSWVAGASVGNINPPGPQYTHANYWGAVFRGLSNSTPDNTKVEIRNCSFWLLYSGETEWTRIATSEALGGGTFSPTYNAGGPEPELLDQFSDGADVVPAVDHIWHFWPDNSYQPVRGFDVVEVLSNCQTRLALRDAQGADDRDSAEYIIHMGADWRDPNDPGCANDGHICIGIGISRFELVTPSWRNNTFHSLTEEDLAAGAPLPPSEIFSFGAP